MAFDLLYDAPEFRLVSIGWHIARIKSVDIKPPSEKAKSKENDKNYVVEFAIDEGSEDDGCTVTKYYPHKAQNDIGLRQLGGLVTLLGIVPSGKITTAAFFDTPKFETAFRMQLPEKLVGLYIDHRPGTEKREDGSTMYFPDIKKFRSVADAQAEMKKARAGAGGGNGPVKDEKPAPTGKSQPAEVADEW